MARSIGKWKLPQPTDIKENNEWTQIPRIARTIPFGYKQSENPDYIEPVQEELDALEQARQYIKGSSYREVADWLFRKTGRRITGMGLRKALERKW